MQLDQAREDAQKSALGCIETTVQRQEFKGLSNHYRVRGQSWNIESRPKWVEIFIYSKLHASVVATRGAKQAVTIPDSAGAGPAD
jgi:hypothetical protein